MKMTGCLLKWVPFRVYNMANSNQIPIIGIRRLRFNTDGHGIRTLIGTADCLLRCKHCLNPHSWNGEMPPKLFSLQSLYDTVKIDNLYFQTTNGGLTFGGGEPLLHMEQISEFISMCPPTWSMCAETSLYVPSGVVYLAATCFDQFIVDIKTTEPVIYKDYSSGNFEVAWNNLKHLCSLVDTDKITVRIPIIPGYVGPQKQQQSIDLISSLGISNIDVFSYRNTKQSSG